MHGYRGIHLHKIETTKALRVTSHAVRIAVPSYDPDHPDRDVGAGWFMGDTRGISITVTDVADLRAVAAVLVEAADQLEAK